MTGHEQWDELAVGHALGALEPEDDQAFAAHLRECGQCGQTLADMEAVAAQLAYGVDEAEPPPALLDSIMSEVRASGRVAVVPRPAARVTSLQPRRTRAWPQPTWLATAAALVLVVALTGWNLQLRADNAAKSRALAARNGYLQAVTDPSAQSVVLRPVGSVPSARAQVLVQGQRAWLVVDGFDQNDTTKQVYVLWKLSADAVTPVRTFDVVHDGPNFIDAGNVADPAVEKFAVSLEPGRVMPVKPTQVVVSA
jgi:anti-sigma-K factor RskA